MRTITLNEDELRRFMAHPDDGPVVMINLLRFRPTTDDGESGEAAYARYAGRAVPFVAQVGGRLLWQGKADQLLIGGEGDRWDRVLMVEYPSRAAFLKMVAMPEFQATQADRVAALESTVLIAATTERGVLTEG
ncbi:DUF1330 domain-containing protein [Rhodocaloribacter sp.]